MKFVTFQVGKTVSYGAVSGDGIVDLGKRLGKKYPTLRAALKNGGLAELKKVAAAARKTDVSLKKIKFLPVIPDAKKIICVGLNYKDHRAETGNKETPHPTLFLRMPASQVGHGQPLIKPRESEKLDWEGELAVIIGKKGRRIPREKAMSYIAGYSCYHDGSVRDFQRHTTQFTPGKNFAGTGGFGPWMVTTDEVKDITKETLTTRVNGVVKQQAGIDLLIFDIPALIAYISTFVPLEGGDVIVTGTPGGVGAARTPPEFLKPGDVTEIDISGVGILRNVVKEG
jgi:2-keto-4-pentenoate hydratase/2-oxohepta-3-ene-1,7-dioic acid hydratase in catechol pathway